jgi:hypothetical protein
MPHEHCSRRSTPAGLTQWRRGSADPEQNSTGRGCTAGRALADRGAINAGLDWYSLVLVLPEDQIPRQRSRRARQAKPGEEILYFFWSWN